MFLLIRNQIKIGSTLLLNVVCSSNVEIQIISGGQNVTVIILLQRVTYETSSFIRNFSGM